MKNAYIILSTDSNPTIYGVVDSRRQASRYVDYLYLKRGIIATYIKSRMIDYNVITVNNVYIKATYNIISKQNIDDILLSIKTEIVDQNKHNLLEDTPDYQIWSDIDEYGEKYFIFKYDVSNSRKQDIIPSSIILAREKFMDRYMNDESFRTSINNY